MYKQKGEAREERNTREQRDREREGAREGWRKRTSEARYKYSAR